MDPALNGLHIGILVTDGFEQVQLTETKDALEREGAITRIISERHGHIQGFREDAQADQFNVDLTFDEAEAEDFDAVLLPGGTSSAARIRTIPKAQQFVQGMQAEGKPIAAICHGTWLLIAAGLTEGRTLAGWPKLQDEIRNAGGNWVDEEVVVDGNLVSSRSSDDLPAFKEKVIAAIAGRMAAHLRGTPDEHAIGIASS
jgi:protease I